MMRSASRLATVLGMALWLAGFAACRTTVVRLSDRMREIDVATTTAVSDAALSCEMALRALDNASALRNDAEAEFVVALRAGHVRAVEPTRAKVAARAKEMAEATDMAQQVVVLAAKCATLAESAKAETKKALESATQAEAESAARSAEKLAVTVDEDLRQVLSLVRTMKERWLLPTNIMGKSAGVEGSARKP
jgi:hypothetical protein